MSRRSVTALALALVASLSLAVPALAGGWAITSFDPLPEEFRAGEAYTLGYTIRQHGDKPFDGAKTSINVWSATTKEWHSFSGTPDGTAVGRYVAQVTFPSAGEWRWAVDQSPFEPQDLGVVTVMPAVPAQTAAPPAEVPVGGISVPALVVLGTGLAVVALLLPRLGSARAVRRGM